MRIFFYLLTFASVVSLPETCLKKNCQLPSCQCPVSNRNPTPLRASELPQLILLTFVGQLNANALDPIRSILHPKHRNPNKCPISATFFASHAHTDYCLVQRLFDNRQEVAMTTSSNKCPLTNCYNEYHWVRWSTDDWRREIKQQRAHLVEHAQLHPSHIKGFRAPHLQFDPNEHFEFLRQYHFHYDSSMVFNATTLMWPFTLDFPMNRSSCVNCNGSIGPFEALWEFPLHEWTYPNATKSCRTLADVSCLPEDRPQSPDLFYELLMHNFERHSSLSIGRRSPFVIELDFSWLEAKKSARLDALLRFIGQLSNSPQHRHVYFVSIERALEWLKSPCSLDELRDFWAFRCSDVPHQYSVDCSQVDDDDPSSEQQSKASGLQNQTNASDVQAWDRQSEKLFPSSIAFHALWISILLISAVFFYDKYLTRK